MFFLHHATQASPMHAHQPSDTTTSTPALCNQHHSPVLPLPRRDFLRLFRTCPPLCVGALWPMPTWVWRDVQSAFTFAMHALLTPDGEPSPGAHWRRFCSAPKSTPAASPPCAVCPPPCTQAPPWMRADP